MAVAHAGADANADADAAAVGETHGRQLEGHGLNHRKHAHESAALFKRHDPALWAKIEEMAARAGDVMTVSRRMLTGDHRHVPGFRAGTSSAEDAHRGETFIAQKTKLAPSRKPDFQHHATAIACAHSKVSMQCQPNTSQT